MINVMNRTMDDATMGYVIDFLQKKRGFKKYDAYRIGLLMTREGINNKKTAMEYLNIEKVKYHDPMLMTDMDKLVARLLLAIERKEKTMIHADYDTDGVTTATVAYRLLTGAGLQCDWYVPDRQKDGYGLHPRNIKRFEEEGYTLLITGDTGIKEMKTISETTMDVIVTDHHEPVVASTREGLAQYEAFSKIVEHNGEFMAIPDCAAVVNPHRIDCSYPNKAVAGVTVMWKAMLALYSAMGKDTAPVEAMIDLVAAGQIADMIPQIDVNSQDLESRKIVLAGIAQIESAESTWAYTFMKKINPLKGRAWFEAKDMEEKEVRTYVKKWNKGKLTITDLGFTIGPFLNAPGRMAKADLSVDFLLEEDEDMSYTMLRQIEKINNERKQKKKEGHKAAMEILANEEDFSAVAVILPVEHHSGYVGLIAGDLARDFSMPTLCFARKDLDGKPVLTASCRSVEGVSILAILMEVEKTFGEYRYGGHQMAAGLTIDEDRFDEFKAILNEVSKRHLEKRIITETAIPVEADSITEEFCKFYIHMGAKSTFTMESTGFSVERVTPNMAKLNLNGTPVWKFNFPAEELTKFKVLEETNVVNLEFSINRFDGEICLMMGKFEAA